MINKDMVKRKWKRKERTGEMENGKRRRMMGEGEKNEDEGEMQI